MRTRLCLTITKQLVPPDDEARLPDVAPVVRDEEKTIVAVAGKREQAQEHVTIATTMYREMGMTYWLEKAAAESAELG